MNFNKIFLFLIIIFVVTNCSNTTQISIKKDNLIIENQYSNKGFAIIYNEDLYKDKSISKKLDNRSYLIFHRNLKKNSSVKVTNLINNKSTIVKVKSNNVDFPRFYNSVITTRIAEDLQISLDEPYIEIKLINDNSSFVAKKTKTFDEEKTVAEKAPVDGITISDLNGTQTQEEKEKTKKIEYTIKIADFYYENTANQMVKRIKNETGINKYKILPLSKTKFRVILGPFSDIKSLRDSFDKAVVLNFENLEIIRNE